MFFCFHQERPNNRAEDPADSQCNRQQQTAPTISANGAKRKRCQNRSDIGFVQIRTHSGHITNIITYVIRNRGRVARVVLRNARFNFIAGADQIGSNIRRLGVDAAPHTGKKRHEGSTHSVHDHNISQLNRVINSKNAVENIKPERNIKDSEANHRKSHYGTGRKSNSKAMIQAF